MFEGSHVVRLLHRSLGAQVLDSLRSGCQAHIGLTVISHHKHPVTGENRASGCEPFEEKCCFRHNETIDPFHKKCLKTKNHRGLEVHFWWSSSIYREIGVENSRDVFLLSRDHALLQRATSDLQKRFLALEFIQRHCQTLMLRISFGLTWTLTPPQPKTWRSMCMCDKLTWTSTHPRTPDVT